MTTTATRTTAPVHLVRCTHCPGVITADGQAVHDHHPSCSYWSLRCRVCQTPITGTHGGIPPHENRPELCHFCGDLLEAESHP